MTTIGMSGGDALRRRLEAIRKQIGTGEVLRVGFLEGATYPDGTPVATIAAIQEFGAPAAGIPPRPFFRQMIAAKSPGWGASMAKTMRATDSDAKRALDLMGEGIQGQLRQSINQFSEPALAPETVRRKGFAKPLIDTGQMISSVAYDVKDGE